MGNFGRLWGAGSLAGLGDGIAFVAIPLLATSLTKDPVQISALMIAEQAPWVLFALPIGAVVDRMDRRLLMALTSAIRVVVLGGLALAVAFGQVSMPLLYAAGVLTGCAGVAFENAAMTVVPEAAGERSLEKANGRMLAARTVGQSLLGPPLGAWLFSIAAWTPFVLDSSAFVLVGLLCLTLTVGRSPVSKHRVTIREAIGEGLRWLLGNRILRTLALTVAMSNVGLGAVLSILVLIAQQRLGLGSVGYGVLLTASAIGGILGGLLADRVTRLLGPGTTLRVGLLVEALAHLGFALTRNPVLAGILLGILGLHLLLFSTVNVSLRQGIAPPEMLGRVHSAYRLLSNGGMFLGAALGGVLATAFGLTAPFWVGAVGMMLVAALSWRVLNERDIAAAKLVSA
jgi:MFS family permease